MSHFEKAKLAPFFDKWVSLKYDIEVCYQNKDKQAVVLMKLAIDNYSQLLEYGQKEIQMHTGKEQYVLLPLNGTERFKFIQDKINSHYAYIQLEALYTETKKKAARLAVSKK